MTVHTRTKQLCGQGAKLEYEGEPPAIGGGLHGLRENRCAARTGVSDLLVNVHTRVRVVFHWG